MKPNKVLVFPRTIFGDVFSLLSWDSVQEQLNRIEDCFSWLERPEAERSSNMVQAIPCAFIKDIAGGFCVLRRVQESRTDLRNKLSLIVGGHIDYSSDYNSFQAAMSSTLMREVEEEVGIQLDLCPSPVGIIIDDSSIEASRHVAFIHEMQAEEVSPLATEEFAIRSKFSGTFMTTPELAKKHGQFDPWSRLLIEQYLCADDVRPKPRQFSFL